MSLFESGDSTGDVSLGALFQHPEEPLGGCSRIDINRLAYLICRGGWPGALDMDENDALAQASDYFDVVCDTDISRVDNVARNPQRVRLLMRSYARHQGTMATIGTILSDLKANESSSLSDIDTTRMASPTFMMVLTGVGDFPYQRDDGIWVVPIGCLKP